MRLALGCSSIWSRWFLVTVTGISVDFNLLREEVTTSPSAKYFHTHGQVRARNRQRTASVFAYRMQGLALIGEMMCDNRMNCHELHFWADDCQEIFRDDVGRNVRFEDGAAHC